MGGQVVGVVGHRPALAGKFVRHGIGQGLFCPAPVVAEGLAIRSDGNQLEGTVIAVNRLANGVRQSGSMPPAHR